MSLIEDFEKEYLKTSNNEDPATFVWRLIIDFFNQDSLLRSRPAFLLEKITKPFPSFQEATIKVCSNLDQIIESNPSLIYNVISENLQDKALITKLIDMTRKAKSSNKEDLLYRLEFVADSYESIEFLKLPAIILCNNSTRTLDLRTKDSILKQLKIFGLSSSDNNNIRLIRNCINHKYHVIDNFIITEEGKKIATLEIDKLYNQLEDIMSWFTTFITYSSYLIPKLGLLIALPVYIEIRHNEDLWDKFGAGMKTIYKDFFAQIKQEKHHNRNRKKTLRKKVKKTIKRISFKIKYRFKWRKKSKRKMPDIFYKNFFHLLDRIDFHTSTISKELEEISDHIDIIEVQTILNKFSKWFSKKSTDIRGVKEFCEEHPEKIVEIFEKTAINSAYRK